MIPNGLVLCKLHHARLDAYIIGVTPDLEAKVRLDVLEEIDGPPRRGCIPLWTLTRTFARHIL